MWAASLDERAWRVGIRDSGGSGSVREREAEGSGRMELRRQGLLRVSGVCGEAARVPSVRMTRCGRSTECSTVLSVRTSCMLSHAPVVPLACDMSYLKGAVLEMRVLQVWN